MSRSHRHTHYVKVTSTHFLCQGHIDILPMSRSRRHNSYVKATSTYFLCQGHIDTIPTWRSHRHTSYVKVTSTPHVKVTSTHFICQGHIDTLPISISRSHRHHTSRSHRRTSCLLKVKVTWTDFLELKVTSIHFLCGGGEGHTDTSCVHKSPSVYTSPTSNRSPCTRI